MIVGQRINDTRPLLSYEESRIAPHVDSLIVHLSAMQGCALTSNKATADCITQTFITFIQRWGYENLSFGEYSLALEFNLAGVRNNPVGEDFQPIPFFGTHMNLAYLAPVLKNYMILRNYVDSLLKNQIDGL